MPFARVCSLEGGHRRHRRYAVRTAWDDQGVMTHDQALAVLDSVIDSGCRPRLRRRRRHPRRGRGLGRDERRRARHVSQRAAQGVHGRAQRCLHDPAARGEGRRLAHGARELRPALQLLPRRRRGVPRRQRASARSVSAASPARSTSSSRSPRSAPPGSTRPRSCSGADDGALAAACARPEGRSRAAGARAGRRAMRTTASGEPGADELAERRRARRRRRPRSATRRHWYGHGEDPLRPPGHPDEHHGVGGDRRDRGAHHPVAAGSGSG